MCACTFLYCRVCLIALNWILEKRSLISPALVLYVQLNVIKAWFDLTFGARKDKKESQVCGWCWSKTGTFHAATVDTTWHNTTNLFAFQSSHKARTNSQPTHLVITLFSYGRNTTMSVSFTGTFNQHRRQFESTPVIIKEHCLVSFVL